MRVAVIIPTRGRDSCLRTTIADLAAQDLPSFELWVVDQNDSPLRDLDKDFGDKGGTRIFHHETMKPLGSHAGRNHAISKSTAEIAVFVDDDVRVPKDFLSRHLAEYTKDATLGAIAGRVIQPLDGLSESAMRAKGRLAKYNATIGRVSGNFFGSDAGSVDHVHECNFSCRMDLLRKVRGFNEEFQGNAYFEGADLALRLKRDASCRIDYLPSIVLTHLQESSGGNRVKQKATHTYWFVRNYCLLNSLHMKTFGRILFLNRMFAYVLAKAIKNGDIQVLRAGVRGIAEGSEYFNLALEKRLRSTIGKG